MTPFEAFLKRNESKLIWYFAIVISSSIPMILRFLTSLDLKISSFDIKDVLFAGLAMNLSNFNLISSKKFSFKVIFALFSATLITIIGFCLGILFCCESQSPAPNLSGLTLCSCLLLAGSFALSYQANKCIF